MGSKNLSNSNTYCLGSNCQGKDSECGKHDEMVEYEEIGIE